jgi:hypothetical protein
MAILTDGAGNRLVDELGQPLTDGLPADGTMFPLNLMLRLRIHACWLTFLMLSVSHTT